MYIYIYISAVILSKFLYMYLLHSSGHFCCKRHLLKFG